ncbi:type II toxin-antitoxin system death-on-curing family toxin [Arthrobacter sp. H5]|uniref:type II toxin-antitoxin system death-on-curing family toxin n=1 Tax=Arthrobacter sp. H5 TaxID=1267973 RepID=UPI00055D96D0|nr:type II toxin-antitoxin system death-on-curing family toxin [Arthrobacter sp. H5]
MTVCLELDDACYVVDSFGFHLRDVGLLQSALARPPTTLTGREAYPALPLKAAALLESLARNHALRDGNKRTAWTLVVVFLGLNGYRHNFTTDTAFDLVVGVASGAIELHVSGQLIEEHLTAS